MIDLHIHSRDAEQAYKETVLRCIKIAYKVGIDGMLVMPNTSPTLTSEGTIDDEFERQDEAIARLDLEGKFWAGVWAGITANEDQIREFCELYKEHRQTDKRIAGGKLYAGKSTGSLGIIDPEEQKFVWHKIVENKYEGPVPVHAEEETEMRSELWDYTNPYTHTLARPPEAEVRSVLNQIKFAYEAGFKGRMHICHISVPAALELIEKSRDLVPFKITCGLTPHHAMLHDKMMQGIGGLYKKMNPPLRTKEMQKTMIRALIDGRINCVESDHAPHTKKEKTDPTLEKPFASGVPVLPYWPVFIRHLKINHLSWEHIHKITHDNVAEMLDIDIPNSKRIEKLVEEGFEDLSEEYEFDAFK